MAADPATDSKREKIVTLPISVFSSIIFRGAHGVGGGRGGEELGCAANGLQGQNHPSYDIVPTKGKARTTVVEPLSPFGCVSSKRARAGKKTKNRARQEQVTS